MRAGHVLTLLFLPTFCFSQELNTKAAGELEKAYPTILQSLVQIRVAAKCKGTTRTLLSTGFIISARGHIAAARHAMLPDCEVDPTSSFVRLASGRVGRVSSDFVEVPFRLVAQEPTKDIVILALEKNPFVGEVHTGLFSVEGGVRREVPVRYGVAPVDETAQPVGTSVAITGYAMNDSVEITRTGMLATGQRFESLAERPVPYASIGGSSTVFYLAALNVRPGDSGAPVYSLQSGKVIGICLGYLPEPAVRIISGGHENAQIDGSIVYSNAGIAVVAPIKYVVSILRNVR